MERLIRANLHFLQQADALLERLENRQYRQTVAAFYESSVGGHLRHCLEHYHSLLAGLGTGRIDYDDRERDVSIEHSANEARKSIRCICTRLEELLSHDPPIGLLVKMDCGAVEIEWQPSTVGRELQFLVSHTVHHFAMIGGICRALGVSLDDEFGVAPSTLRHRARAGDPAATR